MSTRAPSRIKNWRELESAVAELYRSLGCYTRTNARLRGARSSHRADVIVVAIFSGLKYVTIVECKFWKRNVGKAQVAALKAIVDDVGASKGIIVSRRGFQKGAISLSKKSNIDLVNWEELNKRASRDIEMFQYKSCIDEIETMESLLEDHFNSKVDEAAAVEAFWYPTNEFSGLRLELSWIKEGLRRAKAKGFPRNYVFHLPNMNDPRFFRCNTFIEYLSHAKRHIAKLKTYFRANRNQILLDEHPSPEHYGTFRWQNS